MVAPTMLVAFGTGAQSAPLRCLCEHRAINWDLSTPSPLEKANESDKSKFGIL